MLDRYPNNLWFGFNETLFVNHCQISEQYIEGNLKIRDRINTEVLAAGAGWNGKLLKMRFISQVSKFWAKQLLIKL